MSAPNDKGLWSSRRRRPEKPHLEEDDPAKMGGVEAETRLTQAARSTSLEV